MPTDDEGTRVTTRAARKRLGSIDIEPAPSPNTPKKVAAVKKGSDQLPPIAETDGKIAENVITTNGTPTVSRSRKSVSESMATPTTGANTSTPLTGLRRKPGEVAETATPARRVTRRTSTTETFEELVLPVRRVTRRTSTTSEDAGQTASPALAARAKQRMSIVAAPTDATLIEESEEPQNERSDSPAENTRSRVRALSHSPYNSGTDSKNTSAKESESNASVVKDLKIDLEDVFKNGDYVDAKTVKFNKDTGGDGAENEGVSKTKFAKTPKTVKNLSYTNNTTIEVSKLTISAAENDVSHIGDSSTASVNSDKSLEQLAQAIQQKSGLPIAEESIMSSVSSPKVVCPATPRPRVAQLNSISSSTPIAKAAPVSPKKAGPSVVEEQEKMAAKAQKEETSYQKRDHNNTFAGKSSPKMQATTAANRSWSHSVRGSSDKKIDAFGATPDSPAKPITLVPNAKSATPQKGKRKSAPRVVSSDEESDENSNNFEDDQCEEAPEDYQSGDSMDESERDEMEVNEVIDDGESVNSEDSVGAGDADFDDYERDSFLASDEDGNSEELLDGTGDDLSMASETKPTPKKRNSRKLEVSDVSMDSSSNSGEVHKKGPKKGGRILKNPVEDSSSEDEDAQPEELDDHDLEVVKRFQNTVSELAGKPISTGAKPNENEKIEEEDAIVKTAKSPRKSLKGPGESVSEIKKPTKSSTTQEEQNDEEKVSPKKQTNPVEEEEDDATLKSTKTPIKSLKGSAEASTESTKKSRKSCTTPAEQNGEDKASPKKQIKPTEENEDDETLKSAKTPRKSLKGPGEAISESTMKSRKSSTTQEEPNEEKQSKPNEETAKSTKTPRKSLKGSENADKKDQSPKKSANAEDKSDKSNDAKSPPKSAKKPKKSSQAQEEQESDDAASDDEDPDDNEEDNDDESGSGEETSDDDYDDMVEDSEDIEESDVELKKKPKKQQQKSNEAKPTNMFGIKEQRLHVLLQKCHEYVGTKKDELEEMKKKTKGAREAKRQERLKRKEEETTRKQAQDVEDGRTVIKKKKKRKQKKKNPDLGGDETNAEKDLPSIVKKKMEVLEKRKQRNREKKAARKKRNAGIDSTQTNSSHAEVTPTKANKKTKKKDKKATELPQPLQNLPTNISMAALNMQFKLAAAKDEQKIEKKVVTENAPKSIKKASAEETKSNIASKNKKRKELDIVEKTVEPKPAAKETVEDPASTSIPKKKKRQILEIVEKTVKQDKQEQSTANPPASKKRLKILDESGGFSTAQFDVVPVTPEAKLLKKNSGFKEGPITPEPINFKVTTILPKPQPTVVKSMKGSFKEAMRKKLANIQDVDHQLPQPKWKVKPTTSGGFVVTKTKREAGNYIPLSTEGSTTQFSVATLDLNPVANGGGRKKRKIASAVPAAVSNAQKFKENAFIGTAQREPMKTKFRKMDKKKANASSTSFNIF